MEDQSDGPANGASPFAHDAERQLWEATGNPVFVWLHLWGLYVFWTERSFWARQEGREPPPPPTPPSWCATYLGGVASALRVAAMYRADIREMGEDGSAPALSPADLAALSSQFLGLTDRRGFNAYADFLRIRRLQDMAGELEQARGAGMGQADQQRHMFDLFGISDMRTVRREIARLRKLQPGWFEPIEDDADDAGRVPPSP